MLRLNIGTVPDRAGTTDYMQNVGLSLKPLAADPFAQTGPPSQGGPPGMGTQSQGGPPAPAPPPGLALKPLDGDPFTAALTGPQPERQRPGNYQYSQGTEPSATWQSEPGYTQGIFNQGTSRLVDSQEHVPTPPQMGSRTGTPPGQPAPWFGPLDAAATATTSFYGADQIVPSTTSWADRASQLIDAAPQGTGRTPDWNGPSQAAIDQTRRQVMNTPYRPQQGDGTSVGNPTPGVVAYDPAQGDQFGGQASNWALAKASTIPLNSQENLRKRIMIYAEDLGIPPDRFFTDKVDPTNIKYVDYKGQTFSVAPSISGGDWRHAPVDMAQRVMTQGANNAGPIANTALSGAAGMVTGPEFYGPTAVIAAGITGAVGDAASQAAGNWFAERSGYQSQRTDGQPDIDWGHAIFTGVEMAGFEAMARVLPGILNGLIPGFLGNNPYRLTGTQAQDLARVLHDDVVHNGGEILKRAMAARELGINLSPAQLLQITQGIGTHGANSGHVSLRMRLYNEFAKKEITLAHGGLTKRGEEAAQYMREHYIRQARVHFPNAVDNLLDRISPIASPVRGFEEFKKAAGRVEHALEKKRLEAGHQQGWSQLFGSRRIADPTPAIRELDTRLQNAAGTIREELTKLRGELVDNGAPVTRYQRLHQVRLDLERRLDELKAGKKSAAATELENELEGIHDTLLNQLNKHPLYFTGNRAYQEASIALKDTKAGLNPLLKRDPLHQERLGGALADSGPTTVAAARKAFEDAGEIDAWNAHTRAYLETHLRGATGGGGMSGSAGTGYNAGLDFANNVAGRPAAKASLLEMISTPLERDLMDGLVDIGFAISQQKGSLARATEEVVKPDFKSINGGRGLRLAEKASGVLTPLRSLANQGRTFQEWRDMRGARDMAFEMSQPAMKNYKEMTDTAVPLAGKGAEILERGIFAGAPVLENATDAIPRYSPTWVLKMASKYLPPPTINPTAPDLVPPPSGLQRAMNSVLGPPPGPPASFGNFQADPRFRPPSQFTLGGFRPNTNP
jgi:hypothetical protein